MSAEIVAFPIAEHPLHVVHDGMLWRQYTVSYFLLTGSQFTFSVWATSTVDAQLRVEAIRETATLDGELVSVVDATPDPGAFSP